MFHSFRRLILLPLCAVPLISNAASYSPETAREYEQVKKIALRDAKVRAGFEEANERLDAKIVQLDPALANYVNTRKSGVVVEARPEAPILKPVGGKKVAGPKTPKPVSPARTVRHVVKKGETLGSIAKQYQVTVVDLQKSNHMIDARKLKLGQTLIIPGGKAPAHASAENAAPVAPVAPKEKGLWDKLWSDTVKR